MLSIAQQFLPAKAEQQDVRTILWWPSWELMFACLIIVLTAALWYNTTYYTQVFRWYEDLALYKQGALVATSTMLVVFVGMQARFSQNSECLTLMLGAMMVAMMMIVKRIDEKSANNLCNHGPREKKDAGID